MRIFSFSKSIENLRKATRLSRVRVARSSRSSQDAKKPTRRCTGGQAESSQKWSHRKRAASAKYCNLPAWPAAANADWTKISCHRGEKIEERVWHTLRINTAWLCLSSPHTCQVLKTNSHVPILPQRRVVSRHHMFDMNYWECESMRAINFGQDRRPCK